jgi:DNA-binding GntR family transcriptional regulator
MPQVRKSQSVSVFERLRRDILSGILPPGQKLVIDQLCVDNASSLGAVREALSRLASEGLTIVEPFRGYTVAPISAQDLLDLTAARISIERLCMIESIANADIAWESRLVALEHRLARVPQLADDNLVFNEKWAVLHAELHAALAEQCKNKWLLNFRSFLFDWSERYRRIAALTEHHNRDITREHADIISAAIRRDVETTCALLESHIARTAETIKKAFGWDDRYTVGAPKCRQSIG